MTQNSIWAPLLPAAMVGTERQQPPLQQLGGPVGALAQEAAAAAPDAATALLRAAAIVATCGLAGAQPPAAAAPPPAPAGAETRPELARGPLRDGLAWAFDDGPARLHHLALQRLDAAGLRLPHALLPQALELGRRSTALRGALTPVLGARGPWLAAQRDEWRYAAGVATSTDDGASEQLWTDGSLEQRVAFLARERARDAAAGRERLAAALSGLPAKERAELAQQLAIGLGAGDEALLDQLRADRSREVRTVALALLVRLPGAAYTRRACERIGALLKEERVLLVKRQVIDAPTAAAPDWKAEQLDTPRPQHESLGERAWWLYQQLRQVPLPWWNERLGMSADELFGWAAKSDWKDALVRGWRDALMAAPRDDWTEAFIAHGPRGRWGEDHLPLLALLPLAAREQHWQRELAEAANLSRVAHQALTACAPGELLTPALSRAIAAQIERAVAGDALLNDYGLRAQLPELACVLDAAALPPLTRLARRGDETPSLAQSLNTLAQVAELRLALESLPAPKP